MILWEILEVSMGAVKASDHSRVSVTSLRNFVILHRSSGDSSLNHSLACGIQVIAAVPCIMSRHLEVVGEAIRRNTIGETRERKQKLGTDGYS
jgi:hypothetical protein